MLVFWVVTVWRQYVSLKCWYLLTDPHSITTQKADTAIFTTVRTSNLMLESRVWQLYQCRIVTSWKFILVIWLVSFLHSNTCIGSLCFIILKFRRYVIMWVGVFFQPFHRLFSSNSSYSSSYSVYIYMQNDWCSVPVSNTALSEPHNTSNPEDV
jgi:hypothetical protein